ncbi:MAG: response regulator [Bacteroidia bacterium]|nr:response regulator [Bacteroidia bacterium]
MRHTSHEAPADDPAGQSPRLILCVDDERLVLTSLREELLHNLGPGFVIEMAQSGEEALELLEDYTRRSFEVPLVISDQIMPGMKGDELLIEVHRRYPHTRTLMLTGQADQQAVINAVNHAALYRYIAKPWDATDLSLTVRGALDSFEQDRALQRQNEALRRLNEHLEAKVSERTHELVHQKNLIEQQNRDMLDSIRYAKRIQEAVLPDRALMQKLLPQSFVYERPRDIVSGDLYYFFHRRKQLYLAVIDCTGHGVPGAFMSFLAHSQLSQIFREFGALPVHQVLSELNLRILTTLKQAFAKHPEGSVPPLDGMDIALVHLNLESGALAFAGANRPLYRVHNGALEITKGAMRPIGGTGLLSDRVDFQLHELQLAPGDHVYLCTDGLADQFGGATGWKSSAKWGARRFREQLLALAQLPITAQEGTLTTALRDWQGQEPQTDDQLLVGFCWGG